MSEILHLPLLEEIQDVSTCADFYVFTKDEFNKSWSDCDTDDKTDDVARGPWSGTAERAGSRSPDSSAGHSSPYRDSWDPMLCPTTGNNAENNENVYMGLELNLDTIAEDMEVHLATLDEAIRLKPCDKSDVTESIESPERMTATTTPWSLRRKLLSKGRVQERRGRNNEPGKGIQKLNFPVKKLVTHIQSKKEDIIEDLRKESRGNSTKKRSEESNSGKNRNLRI